MMDKNRERMRRINRRINRRNRRINRAIAMDYIKVYKILFKVGLHTLVTLLMGVAVALIIVDVDYIAVEDCVEIRQINGE